LRLGGELCRVERADQLEQVAQALGLAARELAGQAHQAIDRVAIAGELSCSLRLRTRGAPSTIFSARSPSTITPSMAFDAVIDAMRAFSESRFNSSGC
jgi:hypothetical protein